MQADQHGTIFFCYFFCPFQIPSEIVNLAIFFSVIKNFGSSFSNLAFA